MEKRVKSSIIILVGGIIAIYLGYVLYITNGDLDFDKVNDIVTTFLTGIGIIVAALGINVLSFAVEQKTEEKVDKKIEDEAKEVIESRTEDRSSRFNNFTKVIKKILSEGEELSTVEILEEIVKEEGGSKDYIEAFDYINQLVSDSYGYDTDEVSEINKVRNVGQKGFNSRRNQLFGKMLSQLEKKGIISRSFKTSKAKWYKGVQ